MGNTTTTAVRDRLHSRARRQRKRRCPGVSRLVCPPRREPQKTAWKIVNRHRQRKNSHGVRQPVPVRRVFLRYVALGRLHGGLGFACRLPLLLEAFHGERLAAARRLYAGLDAHDGRHHRQGHGYGYRALWGGGRGGGREESKRIFAFSK